MDDWKSLNCDILSKLAARVDLRSLVLLTYADAAMHTVALTELKKRASITPSLVLTVIGYGYYTPYATLLEDIDMSASIEHANDNGEVMSATPLMFAVCTGNKYIVEDLLMLGASAIDYYALTLAASFGYSEITSLLLEFGAHLDGQEPGMRTPLFAATFARHIRVVEKMLEHRGGSEITRIPRGMSSPILHMLCCSDSPHSHDTIKLMVQYLAFGQVNTLDNDGWTALHYAAHFGNPEVVKLLLEAPGANANLARDSNQSTALHEAARKCPRCIDLLISHGALIDVQDSDGNTPLHLAVKEGAYDCIKKLVQHSALRNVYNRSGSVPLHCAVREGNDKVIDLLVHNSEDLTPITRSGSGNTVLHLAIFHNQLATLEKLLGMGCCPNARTKWMETPLDRALIEGCHDSVEILMQYEADTTLVKDTSVNEAVRCNREEALAKLLPRYKMKDGFALRVAVVNCRYNIVRLLLQHGAGAFVLEKHPQYRNRNVIEIARWKGCDDMAELLSSHVS